MIEMDSASEFQVLDRRFGFRNHSFAFQNAGARREGVLKREMVRLPYMTRLMIQDLMAAKKLFCFHDAGGSGRALIDQLVAALGRYGPNWLLWVRPAVGAWMGVVRAAWGIWRWTPRLERDSSQQL